MFTLGNFLFVFTFMFSIISCAASESPGEVIKQLHTPKGFSISVYADNVANARTLALAEEGVVFVGTRQEGKVYALGDRDNNGIVEKHLIAEGLNMPNGVAYKDGTLYVAEVHRIIAFENILANLDNPPKPRVIYGELPTDIHHGWKYLRFGPDSKLYSAVGAPCNICKPDKKIYSSLFRLNPDGTGFEVIAQGIRNTVGFDWQPETNVLFFSDNGRDYLGEDVPPDELNEWSVPSDNFGFPFCHGGDIPDPEYSEGKKCSDFKPPVWKFGAHVAPLGIRFYLGNQFPKEFKNQLFVAEHGSWNRSVPQGYRVVLVKFNKGKPVADETFISGWLKNDGTVLGRPTDILELPDGSLLIADDKLGVIYKVTYTGKP
jgi:glucose/arabinose dehydrogenase